MTYSLERQTGHFHTGTGNVHMLFRQGTLPISGKSLLTQRQNARTQIGDVPVGKDQKTAIVGY
jgi:hypothetical protein